MPTPNDSVEMVAIPKTVFDRLKDSERKLVSLEDAGVDNWDGYDIAMDLYSEHD